MDQAMTAGARCIKSEVVLSRLWSTRLFLSAGMLKVIGPAHSPKTACMSLVVKYTSSCCVFALCMRSAVLILNNTKCHP